MFWRSRISRYSPFYKFLNAFAYWAACPWAKNILLCYVYFCYLANFSFSFFFYCCFWSYFFLYSIIDFFFIYSSLCFSISAYIFFFWRYYYFCLAKDYLAAMIVSFFWLIVDLNSYFFLIFYCLLFSYYSFLYLLASFKRSLNCYKVISSRRPILTYSIYCLGFALILF